MSGEISGWRWGKTQRVRRPRSPRRRRKNRGTPSAPAPGERLSAQDPQPARAVVSRQLEGGWRRDEPRLFLDARPPAQPPPGDLDVAQPTPLRTQEEDDEAAAPPSLALQ